MTAMHLRDVQRVYGRMAAEILEHWKNTAEEYGIPNGTQIKAMKIGHALGWLSTREITEVL